MEKRSLKITDLRWFSVWYFCDLLSPGLVCTHSNPKINIWFCTCDIFVNYLFRFCTCDIFVTYSFRFYLHPFKPKNKYQIFILIFRTWGDTPVSLPRGCELPQKPSPMTEISHCTDFSTSRNGPVSLPRGCELSQNT